MSTNSENVKKVKGSFRKEDISVYARTINKLLKDRQEAGEILPINPEGDEFFYKMSDGMVGIMLLNMIEEDRIDVRTVNNAKLKRRQSLQLDGGLGELAIKENVDLFLGGCQGLIRL